MGELKLIKISSLKSLIIGSYIWNTKKFGKALVGAPIRFSITQDKTNYKWIKCGAGAREGSKVLFSKILKQTITQPLPLFFALLLYFWNSNNICSPPVCVHPMTQKLLNLIKEWGNIGKCLMISTCLMINGPILPSNIRFSNIPLDYWTYFGLIHDNKFGLHGAFFA